MGSDVPRIGVHGEVLPESRLQRKADLNLHLPSMGQTIGEWFKEQWNKLWHGRQQIKQGKRKDIRL